jgi:hypothetical protein
MPRLLIALLAVFCLLTGCSANSKTAEQQPSDLDTLFDNQPADNEVGSANFAMDDPIETVYPYNGQPLEIPFTICGAEAGTNTEIGVLLFVDGVAQPYKAVYADGAELSEAYMQTFHLEYEQQENFRMVFQPVTGKAGETVSVMAVTILKPSFVAEGENNPRYGFYHGESATIPRHISFAVDAPPQAAAVPTADYNITELPKDVVDTMAAWGSLEDLDTTAVLSLVTEDGNVIRSDGKTAKVTLRLYGGPEATFHITLFINHQPVRINNSDYLSVNTQKNKMAEATFQLDTAGLDKLNTIYAIAATAGADDALEINNPIKTQSILLVNKQ